MGRQSIFHGFFLACMYVATTENMYNRVTLIYGVVLYCCSLSRHMLARPWRVPSSNMMVLVTVWWAQQPVSWTETWTFMHFQMSFACQLRSVESASSFFIPEGQSLRFLDVEG